MIYLLHNREQSFLNKLDDCLTVVHEYTSTTISVFTVLLLCPTTVQWQGFLSMTKWQGGKVCRLWLCFIFPLHRHHRPPVVQWLASSRFDSQVWLLKMTNSYVVLYFKSEKKKTSCSKSHHCFDLVCGMNLPKIPAAFVLNTPKDTRAYN